MRVERVVIDTNVLISAALSSRSPPAQVTYWMLENATLLFSRETFAELESRLWRPKFDRYLSLEQRHVLLHDFEAIAEWVPLANNQHPPFSRDPDDDKFVQTALNGAADWLISGDSDLLELDTIEDLHILSPSRALELIRLPSISIDLEEG